MSESYAVLRSYIGDGTERSPIVIAEFYNKRHAYYWIKFLQKHENSKGQYRLYLRTLQKTYRVEELPEKYTEFEQ